MMSQVGQIMRTWALCTCKPQTTSPSRTHCLHETVGKTESLPSQDSDIHFSPLFHFHVLYTERKLKAKTGGGRPGNEDYLTTHLATSCVSHLETLRSGLVILCTGWTLSVCFSEPFRGGKFPSKVLNFPPKH